jgi:hypothetical protein
MLTTTEARIHIGCQFHLKRGEFLLDTAVDTAGGVQMTLSPLSGEGPDVVMDVTAEGMDDAMWSLTVCNFPGDH